jgi:DNA polymerase V
VEKNLVTDQMVLTVGYDVESLKDGGKYNGAVTTDRYGRKIPKHAHGTANLDRQTSSTRLITEAVMELYDRIVNPSLLVRRINLTACKVVDESETAGRHGKSEQLDLFTDYEEVQRNEAEEQAALDKERAMQKTVLELRKKFGKNAVLKGMNLQEDATARDRNAMIGGHKA